MSTTVIEELANYLAGQGLGTVGVDVFWGEYPDSPVQCTALMEYPGRGGDYIQERKRVALEYPRVQVVARAANYATGRQLIENAYQILDNVVNTTVYGTRYLKVMPLQAPFLHDRDANRNVLFAFNVEAWRVAA